MTNKKLTLTIFLSVFVSVFIFLFLSQYFNYDRMFTKTTDTIKKQTKTDIEYAVENCLIYVDNHLEIHAGDGCQEYFHYIAQEN